MPELGFEAEIKVSWTKEVGEDSQQRHQSEQRKEKNGSHCGNIGVQFSKWRMQGRGLGGTCGLGGLLHILSASVPLLCPSLEALKRTVLQGTK